MFFSLHSAADAIQEKHLACLSGENQSSVRGVARLEASSKKGEGGVAKQFV